MDDETARELAAAIKALTEVCISLSRPIIVPDLNIDATTLRSPGHFLPMESPTHEARPLTDEQVKDMVDRFLNWKLPADFNPDGGISFDKIAGADGPHPFEYAPTGTNLLTAVQATDMVRHMLAGLPGARTK